MFKLHIYLLFTISVFANSIITPIPQKVEGLNTAKAALGEVLFFDKRLSKDNTISCASCHDVLNGGDDNLPKAVGINGLVGSFNTPTVLNSNYNFTQFWDGRAKTLKEQVSGPIHNPIEMASNFEEIISKLTKDTFYIKEFREVYSSAINEENIIDAIVEFERSLITPNSRFDKYLNGDDNILTKQEKRGYELFKDYGCISCHNGVNIGGNLFQKIGIMEEYYPNIRQHLGRYNFTVDEDDKFYFKVPTLRNIELTAPYLHDGSIKSLSKVIEIMLKYQVGIVYTTQDIEDIEKFLKTLTGDTPKI